MNAPVDQNAPTQPGSNGQTPAQAQPLLYPSLEAWVVGYFTPMFLHRASDSARARWCARWWDHAEVIARLNILWDGWEAARWQEAAKSPWWSELDHHLQILLATDGPFRNCRLAYGNRDAKHQPDQPPTSEPAPDRWWG